MLNTLSRKKGLKPAQARQAGLSLVEVLVTLSITGLASVLIVATAQPADALRSEHARLVQLLQQLDARSKVSGAPAGLFIEHNGYAPAAWRDNEWQVIERQRRVLPAKMRLGVETAYTGGPQILMDPLMPSALPLIRISEGNRELDVTLPREDHTR